MPFRVARAIGESAPFAPRIAPEYEAAKPSAPERRESRRLLGDELGADEPRVFPATRRGWPRTLPPAPTAVKTAIFGENVARL
jgi:hypothetical protein